MDEDIDEVVVERLIAGSCVPANSAEKDEAVRRMLLNLDAEYTRSEIMHRVNISETRYRRVKYELFGKTADASTARIRRANRHTLATEIKSSQVSNIN